MEKLIGSCAGIETISHVRENGRIVVQFNAFDGPPRIVRLWGKGALWRQIILVFGLLTARRLCRDSTTPFAALRPSGTGMRAYPL